MQQAFATTIRQRGALLALGILLGATGGTATAGPLDSELMPLAAERGLFLDLTEAASRAVAVGDRGQILVSESRSEWRQVPDVPTRSTLTAVSAVDDQVWAVGHDGIILASKDGGLSWVVQRLDILDTDPDAEFDPRQGMPLLDILMLDAQRGFAIGAYSQLLRTTNGGETWEFVPTGGPDADLDDWDADDPGDDNGFDDDSWTLSDDDLMLDDLEEPHFNAIARTGSGGLLIVGERGSGFRSRDGGASWERINLPYSGSMFGLIGYENEQAVAFGMRGNVFETDDLGDTWTEVDAGTEQSLMGGAAWGRGGFVLVGNNGVVAIRKGRNAAPETYSYTTSENETAVLAGVLVRPNRTLVVAGDHGVDQFTPRSR